MESSLSTLQTFDFDTPLSFHILYYREKAIDLVRLRNWSELAEFLAPSQGWLADHMEEGADKTMIVNDVLGDRLLEVGLALAKGTLAAEVSTFFDQIAGDSTGYGGEVRKDCFCVCNTGRATCVVVVRVVVAANTTAIIASLSG